MVYLDDTCVDSNWVYNLFHFMFLPYYTVCQFLLHCIYSFFHFYHRIPFFEMRKKYRVEIRYVSSKKVRICFERGKFREINGEI